MISSAMRHLNERRSATGEADSGFTLIELMVVLLILAILLAIAIPTFLGVTKSANDRAAQSNLNTAFVNAKSAFQQNSQSYAASATLVTSLISAEPSLSFLAAGTQLTSGTAQSTISVQTAADGNAIVLAGLAKGTGNCWYIVDNTQSEGASLTAPWSSSTTTFTATSVPTSAGTWYGEWKNVSGGTAVNCDANVPPTGSASNYSFQSTGGFPSL